MMTSSRGVEISPPKARINPAVTMPPMRICPSAPMFQKRILKAGASPTPMHSSIMASRTVTQLRRGVPKAPSKMPSYTWKGFSLVTAKMKMPLTTRDSSTAMIRMAHALGRAMPSRLAMRSRGSLWVLPCVMPPSPPLQSGSSAGPLPLWWWCGRPQYR